MRQAYNLFKYFIIKFFLRNETIFGLFIDTYLYLTYIQSIAFKMLVILLLFYFGNTITYSNRQISHNIIQSFVCFFLVPILLYYTHPVVLLAHACHIKNKKSFFVFIPMCVQSRKRTHPVNNRYNLINTYRGGQAKTYYNSLLS